MLDSNVIFSAFYLPNSFVANIVKHIKKNHEIVLSRYILDEVRDNFQEKYPNVYENIKNVIDYLPDCVVDFDNIVPAKYPYIKDQKDLPILAFAIESNVDILITGDTHFDIAKNIMQIPRILKPREYYDEFMI